MKDSLLFLQRFRCILMPRILKVLPYYAHAVVFSRLSSTRLVVLCALYLFDVLSRIAWSVLGTKLLCRSFFAIGASYLNSDRVFIVLFGIYKCYLKKRSKGKKKLHKIIFKTKKFQDKPFPTCWKRFWPWTSQGT